MTTKIQKPLLDKDYVINIVRMTNLELLRERESVTSLLHVVNHQYPFWKNRFSILERELLKRSLITIN